MEKALLSNERNKFHKALLDVILSVDDIGIPSNADKSNRLSVAIAKGIHARLLASAKENWQVNEDTGTYTQSRTKAKGQTSGNIFEEKVMEYLAATFPKLQHIRPGKWHILKLGNQSQIKTSERSDRAQNSRTEALNLIRNRKGNLPHIVVVTGEPAPSRLASLALGTGDIDCLYHFALYELMEAVHEYGADDAENLLSTLIDGKRLKDISDLPLDLSV